MNFKQIIKKHWIYVLILVIIILFQLQNFISLTDLPTIDHSTTYLARNYILKESFSKYGDLTPLWNPYLMGGTPYMDYVLSLGIFSITAWIVLLFKNMIVATNLNYALDVLLAALVMYITAYYLTKSRRAALISGMIYGLGGPMIRLFHHGALTQLNGIILTPLVYLFMVRTFKQKTYLSLVNNAIILGLVFSLQARFNPDLKIVLFVAIMFGLYLVFQLVCSPFKKMCFLLWQLIKEIFKFNFKKLIKRAVIQLKNLKKDYKKLIKKSLLQLAKVFLVGLIVGVIFSGISSQRLLPGNEFIELTSRGSLPFEKSASRKTEIKDLFKTVIQPLYPQALNVRPGLRSLEKSSPLEGVIKIGIISLILMICALIFKHGHKKEAIFLAIVSLFALSITTGSYVFYLLWKYVPPFDSFRYLERVYSLFLVTVAGLSGLGVNAILKKIKKTRWKHLTFIVFIIIGALVFLDLAIFNMEPTATYAQANIGKLTEDSEIMKYLGEKNKDETFRIHVFETRGIDWTTEYLQMPYGLECLYGEEGTWLVEYMNIYLSQGTRDRAKFWGMLNVKYVTSTKLREFEGLELIKKFDNCTVCPPNKQHLRAWGPYLYENEKVMPRGYIVDNAILMVGEKNKQMNSMYKLLKDKRFDPKITVALYGREKVDQYSIEELNKYQKIVLTDLSENDNLLKLKQYVKNGGIIFPDIFKGGDVTTQDVDKFLEDSGQFKEVKYTELNFDNKEFETGNNRGWLVVSEKFSSFPGWHTKDIEKEIHKANGIVSAIWLDGDEGEKIVFEYKPKSYVIGTWIMQFTILALLCYAFIYIFKIRKKDVNHENQKDS